MCYLQVVSKHENIEKFFLNGALMVTGYSTVSSAVVLWLMMGYVLFFLFGKDCCVFQPVSVSGLSHGIVG